MRFLLFTILLFTCILTICRAAPIISPLTKQNDKIDNADSPKLPGDKQLKQHMTNAERLAKGLPLNKPPKLYLANKSGVLQPRASAA